MSVKAENSVFDSVQNHPFRPDRVDRIAEADKQPFEVILAAFLDLASFDPHMVDHQLPGVYQPVEIVAERGDVGREILGAFLKAHEDAGLIEQGRAVDQECGAKQGLAASGRTADQCRAA